MAKQELIEKAESCRILADEILADVQDVKGKARWELVYRAERMLDAVDSLFILTKKSYIQANHTTNIMQDILG